MSKFTDRIRALGAGVVRSFREFPVEALLGVTFFVLSILTDLEVMAGVPFLYFLPLYILTFCLHRFARQCRKVVWTALYIASWALWIPVWLLCPDEPGKAITIVIYLVAFIVLFAGCSAKDNESYGSGIIHTLFKGIEACLIGGLLSGVISAIIASVSFLFLSGHIHERWYVYPNLLIWLVLVPLLCCLFISEKTQTQKGNKFLTILVDYILSPGLLIYSVILYLYILRILFQWRLPDGGVAYLVGSFIGVALVCRLLQELLEVRHFDWYYKFFPYMAIAPLLLLWIGVFRRVGEYGLTEQRFYLIAAALLLTLFTAFLLFPKMRSFQRMSLIVGGAAILITFIPGIRAKDFGIRSQQTRLEKMLPLLLTDGKLPSQTPYREIAASPELEKAWKAAYGAWRYLEREMGNAAFEARYGQYGTLMFDEWRLREEKGRVTDPPVLEEGEMKSHFLSGHVDLGDYTRYLDSGEYHYYEDSSVAIFYADETRTTELLRCEIVSRLEALDQADDPAAQADSALLVYRNDQYLAIFEQITDYRTVRDSPLFFTTGRRMLFTRP